MNTTTKPQLDPHILDGAPFHAAVAWYRLGAAADAVHIALVDGMDSPIYTAIEDLRSEVWSVLWDATTTESRDEVLARAKEWLANVNGVTR